MSTLGWKLQRLRKEKNLTQNELGERIGVDGRQISRYENGRVVPTDKILKRFGDFFGVSVEHLVDQDSKDEVLPTIHDPELYRQFVELEKLESREKEALKVIIQAVLAKNQVQEFLLQQR